MAWKGSMGISHSGKGTQCYNAKFCSDPLISLIFMVTKSDWDKQTMYCFIVLLKYWRFTPVVSEPFLDNLVFLSIGFLLVIGAVSASSGGSGLLKEQGIGNDFFCSVWEIEIKSMILNSIENLMMQGGLFSI
ncbi:uncharacterized protein DS421_3g96530 [Arachis hypogaea]|nr:uncharacterized protein DS421_3g96530 [Arachis hypogaea]